jgi:general secretion pathway protein G
MAKIQRVFRASNLAKAALFEGAITTMLFGTFSGGVIYKTWEHQKEAEAIAVRYTVSALKSSLRAKVAVLVLHDQRHRITEIARENPIDWLAVQPQNYLGELYSPDVKKLQPGNWFYDKRDNSLVYLLNKENLVGDDLPNMLKFKVKFSRLPTNTAKPPGTSSGSEGVDLEQIL